MVVNQHGRNSSRFYTCVIGDRRYRTVKIGNRVWTAENLEYAWAGLDLSTALNPITGTVSTPTAWYYNDDESTYGLDGTKPCGLLYNTAAFEYLENHPELLPAGWRLPNRSDITDLRVTQANSDGAHLKVVDGTFNGWPSGWNGDDSLGFGLVPTGYRTAAGSFSNVDSNTGVRCTYKQNGNYTYMSVSTSSTTYFWEDTTANTSRAIRLVRDA